jgi:hypothetical protein
MSKQYQPSFTQHPSADPTNGGGFYAFDAFDACRRRCQNKYIVAVAATVTVTVMRGELFSVVEGPRKELQYDWRNHEEEIGQ